MFIRNGEGRSQLNEKGFMFPVTLCILLLFSTFLSVHFNQYISDKRFLTEVEHFERNQYYFLQSLKKVENLLMMDEPYEDGAFVYEKGTVNYHIINIGEELLQINFRLNTEAQTDLTAMCYFDTKAQKVIKWIERN